METTQLTKAPEYLAYKDLHKSYRTDFSETVLNISSYDDISDDVHDLWEEVGEVLLDETNNLFGLRINFKEPCGSPMNAASEASYEKVRKQLKDRGVFFKHIE